MTASTSIRPRWRHPLMSIAAHASTQAGEISCAIGQGSDFENEHGFYADALWPSIAALPEGWQSRLVQRELPDGIGAFDWLLMLWIGCENLQPIHSIHARSAASTTASLPPAAPATSPGWSAIAECPTSNRSAATIPATCAANAKCVANDRLANSRLSTVLASSRLANCRGVSVNVDVPTAFSAVNATSAPPGVRAELSCGTHTSCCASTCRGTAASDRRLALHIFTISPRVSSHS